MFQLKILVICALLSVSLVNVFVFGQDKECVDCRLIYSCKPALSYIRSLKNMTSETKKVLTDAFCGFENEKPKVCCSNFPTNELTPEKHPNIALLPNECGEIDKYHTLDKFPHMYEFPWMALISYNTSVGLKFDCAGSIINSRYVLTAAHCVTSDEGVRNIAGVRIGEFDLSTDLDCYGEQPFMVCESNIQDLRVEDIIVHENYAGHKPVHADIALIRLQDSIDFRYNNADPICLPVTKELQEVSLAGKRSTVLGWGLADQESTLLWKVDIPILTGDDCNQYYNRSQDRDNNTFCAGEWQRDPCKGDSGAPLLVKGEYNGIYRYVQYGIVSPNPRQCTSTFPGVYTDVTMYMSWILDKIKK